jgi:hypothetical protein
MYYKLKLELLHQVNEKKGGKGKHIDIKKVGKISVPRVTFFLFLYDS